MRGKEEAHDYRYYPDPDLVPLVLEEAWIDRWRGELPELPAARRQRFQTRYGLPAYDAALLTSERAVADYFEAAVAAYDEPKKISNWMMTDFLREVNARQMDPAGVELPPEHLARLVAMVDEGAVSGKVGKQVFADIFETGRDPEAYCREKGLVQISDASALEGVVAEVVAANPDEAARYAAGEKKLSGFFIGQVMKETKGQANPKLVAQLLDRMTRA
jgi:aspartyl-tRNA(Asn)/glutamyl-tRNA(Gln) amidotransferase subunit B